VFFSSWLFRLPILRKYDAITLWRWVFFKRPEGQVSLGLVAHEHAHLCQIEELGAICFYADYLWQFARGLVKTRSWDKAYRSISFEIEAYAAQREAGG
jgi:hypothetical protein